VLYKVWAKGKFAQLWCYDFFRESVNGVIFSYEKDTDGQNVRSAIIRVDKPIPQSMFDHFFLEHILISDE
jgi:hypothetical protein